jgi:hypothetical protein
MAVLDGLADHLRDWAEQVADLAGDQVREETARDAPFPFGERVSNSAVTSSADVFTVMIGVDIDPFEWVHDDPQFPFDPHVQLGEGPIGPEFLDVDDPALANDLTFPAVEFFTPQDHAGCLCQTNPTDGSIANPWFQDPLEQRWHDALQQAGDTVT